jgi:hypothetical protein
MRFNVNDRVRVRLNDKGRAIHRGQFDDMKRCFPRLSIPYTPPKEDADGWSEWQLWVLMEIFGQHMNTGFDPPFETTIEIPGGE